MEGYEGSVLIVDDDEALLEALSETLRLRLGSISLRTCDSGKAALALIEADNFDAVISDIKMPGMDGLELLEKIHSIQPELPVLLITGHGETNLAIQALRAGAYDLIQKPLDRDYLVVSLKRAIETRCLRREVERKEAALAAYAVELESRVEVRTEELNRANRAKDEFLGLVSHELRTPVTVIYGNTEILQARLERLSSDDLKQAIDDLSYESRRLLRIIENMLVLARVELGAKPERLPQSISKLVSAQVASHQRYFPEREITVEIEGKEVIECDATYMELIIGNLLSNAEKYSAPDLPIHVRVTAANSEATIAILDRGRGIRPGEVDLLFAPFYRSPEVEGKVGGMGIGLAVCKRLVEAQGGRIWAEPRSGGGSVFGISMPLTALVNSESLVSTLVP